MLRDIDSFLIWQREYDFLIQILVNKLTLVVIIKPGI